MPSTRTIQQVVNLASTHSELLPLVGVGGFNNEPALSLANDTLAEILAAPFAWKFNRKTMNLFVPQQNKQDLKFGGATAFTLASSSQLGGVGIALASASTPGIVASGTTATVTTLDPHNFTAGDTVYLQGCTVSYYNATFTQTASQSSWSGGFVIQTVPTSTSFTITITGTPGNSGAPGITDFGWAEYATMVNENEDSSPQWVRYLMASRELEPCSHLAIPSKISVVDNQDGTVTIRVWELAGAAPWGITVIYQAKAPMISALTASWSPIPDEFAFVVNAVFLAKAFDYIGSARAPILDQKAQRAIAKALAHDDSEGSAEYVVPESPLMGWYWQ